MCKTNTHETMKSSVIKKELNKMHEVDLQRRGICVLYLSVGVIYPEGFQEEAGAGNQQEEPHCKAGRVLL